MAKKTKAQIEKEIAEVEAIKNQLQEEKRQADGLPSTQDSAQGAIIREAQKLATQIVRERDALEQKTTTGKIYSRFETNNPDLYSLFVGPTLEKEDSSKVLKELSSIGRYSPEIQKYD